MLVVIKEFYMGQITSKKTTGLEPVVFVEKKVVRKWVPARRYDPSVERKCKDREEFFKQLFTPK